MDRTTQWIARGTSLAVLVGWTALGCSSGDDTNPEDGGPPAVDSASDGGAGDTGVADASLRDTSPSDAPGDTTIADAPGDTTIADAPGDTTIGDGQGGDAPVADGSGDATSDGPPCADGSGDAAVEDAGAEDTGAPDAGLDAGDGSVDDSGVGCADPYPFDLDLGHATCGTLDRPLGASFTVTNEGTAPVTWHAILPAGALFTLDRMSSTLAPAESVAVNVLPLPIPQYPGSPSIQTYITIDSAPFPCRASVFVREEVDGVFILWPQTDVDFGDVPVGSSAEIVLGDPTLQGARLDVGPGFEFVAGVDPHFQPDVTFSPSSVGEHMVSARWVMPEVAPWCSTESERTFTIRGRGI